MKVHDSRYHCRFVLWKWCYNNYKCNDCPTYNKNNTKTKNKGGHNYGILGKS